MTINANSLCDLHSRLHRAPTRARRDRFDPSRRRSSSRWFHRGLSLTVAFLVGAATARAADNVTDYVRALRDQGYADLAIDYLRARRSKPELSQEERSDLDFEIATSLVSASETLDDLSRRERMLEDARSAFAAFAKDHPNHRRLAESWAQIATIDLQQGRLAVARAQSPANQGRAEELARQSRQHLAEAIAGYDKATDRFLADYKKMPVFIPDESAEDRSRRRRKTRLFEQYIEARFQAALARFYLADTFVSIESPGQTSADQKAKRKKEYDQALEEARKRFEAIHQEHRRELVGLYAQLWMARCLAAQGEDRRAMGIFEMLIEHDNRELAPLQREVFHFRLLLLARRREYEQIIAQGNAWLEQQVRFSRERAALGVAMEVANANLALAEQAADPREQTRRRVEAHRMFDRIASFPNEYANIARREQLRLAPYLTGGNEARGFHALYSKASAKLDAIKADAAPESKKAALSEARKLLEDALRQSRGESADAVADARVSLIYACLQQEDVYSAAVLAEDTLARFPRSTSAPQAALLGMTAYAWAFERADQLQKQNIIAYADVDARRLTALGRRLIERWPTSKEANEARLTMGRLAQSRQDFPTAAKTFDSIDKESPLYDEGRALAGVAYWEAYRQLGRRPESAKDASEFRTKAIERLEAAGAALSKQSAPKVSRPLFWNNALLAEAYFEQGADDKVLPLLEPMVKAIESNSVAADVEPSARISVLTTLLQAEIRREHSAAADRLIDLLVKERGQGQSADITAIFGALAQRLKEQLARLKGAGDEKKREALEASFERFLDRFAEREAGQTAPSLLALAENFLELNRPEKSVGALRRARDLATSSATENSDRALAARIRLLLARSLRRAGQHPAARAEIDALLKEHQNVKEVFMERGAILDAAKDYPAAIAHWKWVIRRLQPSQPRPDEFYQAMDALLSDFERLDGPEKAKRISEGTSYVQFLLNTDVRLPPRWRPIFEEHARRLGSTPST